MICLRKSVKQDEKLLMPLLKSDRNMEVLKVTVTYDLRTINLHIKEYHDIEALLLNVG